MTSPVIITAVIRLIVGGLAAFFAILLLPRIRNAAWICVISGVIITYAGIVYDMLILFGVIGGNEVMIAGISVLPLLFELLPLLLYCLGFIITILHRRRY